LYNHIGYSTGKITVKFCQKESPLPWWERARVRGNKTFPFHPHLTSSPIKGEEFFRDIYYKKLLSLSRYLGKTFIRFSILSLTFPAI